MSSIANLCRIFYTSLYKSAVPEGTVVSGKGLHPLDQPTLFLTRPDDPQPFSWIPNAKYAPTSEFLATIAQNLENYRLRTNLFDFPFVETDGTVEREAGKETEPSEAEQNRREGDWRYGFLGHDEAGKIAVAAFYVMGDELFTLREVMEFLELRFGTPVKILPL